MLDFKSYTCNCKGCGHAAKTEFRRASNPRFANATYTDTFNVTERGFIVARCTNHACHRLNIPVGQHPDYPDAAGQDLFDRIVFAYADRRAR
jgi:hypothetical protein